MVMRKSRQASTGRATRNTTASSRLMEKATAVAATSITGPRQKGRMPVETRVLNVGHITGKPCYQGRHPEMVNVGKEEYF